MAKKVRKQPETLPLRVVMIFVPGDGNFHAIGARKHGAEWVYSTPQILPEGELEPFITEGVESQNLLRFDIRGDIAISQPGREKATPILLYHHDLTLQIAVDAYSAFLQAILNNP